MERDRTTTFASTILIIIATLFCGFNPWLQVDKPRSIAVIQAAGFTQIKTTGWVAFGCGKEDWYRTGFVAKNVHDKPVEGTVCCGLIAKQCTVRF